MAGNNGITPKIPLRALPVTPLGARRGKERPEELAEEEQGKGVDFIWKHCFKVFI